MEYSSLMAAHHKNGECNKKITSFLELAPKSLFYTLSETALLMLIDSFLSRNICNLCNRIICEDR